MKSAIVRQIGVEDLERPAQVAAALAANDRIKVRLSLLQYARSHADAPEAPLPDLRAECEAAGLAAGLRDEIVARAQTSEGGYRIQGSPALLAALADDLEIMAAPLGAEFAPRLAAGIELMKSARTDVLDGVFIDRLTRVEGTEGPQLHRLVMDMHKALNRLQMDLAEEQIDGVAAYQVADADRPLIKAFAKGLASTAPLKFDHPGLASTATRSGTRLLLQNDIGTTDAHVLVVQVENLTAQITYSDVHPERLEFFQHLFDGTGIEWGAAKSGQLDRSEGQQSFVLTVGHLTASDPAGLQSFLERLGSRLVFLIDWNKARKQLRDFLPAYQRLDLLRWAADNDVGHRGFLELGGARLVNDAVEAAADGVIHFGDRLYKVLGEESAYRFLQFCLKAATEALLSDQSPALVRDRVRAELMGQINASGDQLALATMEHAAVIGELAGAAQRGLLDLIGKERALGQLARRAKAWEHRADEFLVKTRQLVRRRPDHQPFCRVLEAADDAADALEEAVFLIDLAAPQGLPAASLQALETLSAAVVQACQEWVKAVSHVNHIRGLGAREDATGFLTAVDRIGTLEHETDDGERRVTVTALGDVADFRQLHLVVQIGARLEDAVDALRRASLILRDQLLSDALA